MPTPQNGTLIKQLVNYGVAGIMLAVVCGAFWCFAKEMARSFIDPMVEERALLIVTLKANVEANQDTMRSVAGSMDRMSTAVETLSDTMAGMQLMLETFTEEVRHDHPEQSKKLDSIIQKLNGSG